MTPEGKVKAKVKRILNGYECYQFWPVQTGYGASTLDNISCYKGYYFAIETKAPGKKPTPRQLLVIEAIQDAGGRIFVIDGEESSYEELRTWLDTRHLHREYQLDSG
jgi:hypothetical protein